jgi:VCBS repeat-containing protein
MLAVSVDGFHLLHDTGLSDNDQITSDPTVTGVVNGDFAGGRVQVEFDHYADGYSEGYVDVDTPGESFIYDPRSYDSSLGNYSSLFALNYRAVEYDAMSNVVSTTAWQSFTFAIGLPEISVVQQLDGYTYVVDNGMGWISFGSTPVGMPVEKLLTITNEGQDTLTLDANSLTLPSGFSASTVFAPSLSPGATSTLVLRLGAAEAGYYGGTVSFGTNDGDENPFEFHVEGNVVPPAPEIAVTTDNYGSLYDLYSGSDWVYFDSTPVGSPVTKSFTIRNTGTADLLLDPNSLGLPAGFEVTAMFAPSVPPGGSTALTLRLTAQEAGYHSGLVSFSTNDGDENPFQFYVGGDVMGGMADPPAMVIWDQLYLELPDGTGSVDLGTTIVGAPLTYTFTIANQGGSVLTLDAESLALPEGFAVWSWFDGAVAPYGGQTWLTIGLPASAAGAYSGTLSLGNNDPDNHPYDIAVSGTVTGGEPAPEIVVRDAALNDLADGTGSVDIGWTTVGTPLLCTFTIANMGDADLWLSPASLEWPAGFGLVTPFAETVAAGGQTQLTLRLDAAAAGTFTGQVSFATNDANENPFSFTLTGSVAGVGNSAPAVVAPLADLAVDEDSPETVVDLAPVFDDADLPQGDRLTFAVAANTNAPLVTATVAGAQLALRFAPDAHGSATIRLTATDSAGAAAQDEFVVTVRPVNDGPLPAEDTYRVLHDTWFSGNVLANDRDPDGDPLTAALVSQPQHGTLLLDPDGAFSYMPETGFIGQDLFAYRVSDGLIETPAVPVELLVYNTEPVATADEFVTRRNFGLTVAAPGVLGNDVDLDGDALTVTLLSGVAHGTLALNPDGGFWFLPNADFVGRDSFSYCISDGVAESQTVTVGIEVRNNPPRAAGDSFSLTPGEMLSVDGQALLANDCDFDGDALTAMLTEDVRHGTLVFGSDGAFSYMPAAGFAGFDTFQYRLSDGTDLSEPAVVFIEVANARPHAEDRWLRVVHDRTLTVDAESGLLAWARDADGQPLSVVLVNDVNHGTLTIQSDGGYTYVPHAGFAGIDSFAYRVSDGIDHSATAIVKLEVANAAPAATNDVLPFVAGQTLTVASPGVLQNDADLDSDPLTVTLVSDVTHGTLTLQPDGAFTYAPAEGFSGWDSFTYQVSDGIGKTYATAYVQALGGGGADALHAADDHYQTAHGRPLSIGHSAGVLANDHHPHGDWLDAVLVTGPAHGGLTLYEDGSFLYTPTDAAYVGSDSFTYKATDGTEETDTVTVSIDVVNSPPAAAGAAFQVHHDQTLYAPGLGLMEFVSDTDHDDLTITVLSDVAHGDLALSNDGTLTYTPDAGFVGADSFTYKLNDGAADSNPATVIVDITNTKPTAAGLTYQVLHGTTLDSGGVGVLSAASDADGDVLTAELVSGPAHGTLSLLPDGTFTYTPNQDFAGTDSFTFTTNDGAESSVPATATIYVLNEAPVAAGATHSVHHADTLSRWLEAWDPDADAVTYHVTDNADHGTLTVNAEGQFTYTPDRTYVGTDTFKYKVNDGIADSNEATVTLQVTNAKPKAIDQTFKIHAGESIGRAAPGLLDRAWDANGDTLAVVGGQTLTLAHGTLTVGSDGAWSYQSTGTTKGVESFTYQVHDGAQASDAATVTIHVNNEPPRAYDQYFHFLHRDGAAQGGTKTYSFNLRRDGWIIDPDEDPVTIHASGAPSNVMISENGSGSVTVPAGYVGQIQVSYTARDRIEESAPATATIEITNYTPRAHDDYFSIRSGQTLQFGLADLFRNDFDLDADGLTLVSMGNPSAGSLTYDDALGTYVYDPGGFVGEATLTYQVTDGAATGEATVHIDVVNTAPWTVAPDYQVFSDQTLEVGTLATRGAAWDLETDAEHLTAVSRGGLPVDATGALTYTATTDPAVIAARMAARGFVLYNEYDWLRADYTVSDGLLENEAGGDGDLDGDNVATTYVERVPNPSFSLSDWVLPHYKLIDVQPTQPGGLWDASQIDASAPPVAVADVFWGLHDHNVTGNLLSNDLTLGGSLQFVALLDENGTPAPPQHGQIAVGPDGSFTYAPDPGYVGEDTFWYTVSDGTRTGANRVSLYVQNTEPMAFDDGVFAVLHGQPYTGNLLANDVEVDDWAYGKDGIWVASVAGAPVGAGPAPTSIPTGDGVITVDPSGDFTFTPTSHATGPLSITYSITDGADTDAATLRLAYFNQAPLVRDQRLVFGVPASSYPISIAADAVDGDPLTYTIGSVGAGTVAPANPLAPDNQFVFTPPQPDWTGTVQIPVTVTDNGGVSSTAQITLQVCDASTSSGPNAADDQFAWWGGDGSLGNVLGNDSTGQPPLQVVGVQPAAGAFGTLQIDANGMAHYSSGGPMADALRQRDADRFLYTVEDALGNRAQAEVRVSLFVLPPGQSISYGGATLSNGGPSPFYAWLDGQAHARYIHPLAAYWAAAVGADLDWAGPASSLRLGAPGIASQVQIGGELEIGSSGDVPHHVQAGHVKSINAYGRVENVFATDRITLVYGGHGVGRTRSLNDTVLVIAPYIGNVDSVVSVYGSISAVYASQAMGDVGEVHARQSIGFVTAGRDVRDGVRAELGDVGFLHLPEDWVSIMTPEYREVVNGQEVRGVFAGRDVLGPVGAGRDVTVVWAGDSVTRPVTAGRDILLVRAEEGEIAETVAVRAERDLGTVDAEQGVAGDAHAGHYLGAVRAGQEIASTAQISALSHIGGILAGTDIRAEVFSLDGSITNVTAGYSTQSGSILQAALYAGRNIGEVTARLGAIGQTTIRAAEGYLGNVTAGLALEATIEAAAGIGTVSAGTNLRGRILSQNSYIEEVKALDGELDANVQAATDLGPVFAKTNIRQPLRAIGIARVTAETGEILGDITAASALGNVTAGTHIRGKIAAGISASGLGNIGELVSGKHAPGDIWDTVTAGRDIALVRAQDGPTQGSYVYLIPPALQSAYQQQLAAWLADPNASAASVPKPPRADAPPVGSAGTIHQRVDAGRNLGAVAADKDILEKAQAGQRLDFVGARGNIEQGASSNQGATTVVAGRALRGLVTTQGCLFAHSYDQLAADLRSALGAVVGDSWATISGRLEGKAGVHAAAYDSISSPTVTSSDGPAALGTYGSVNQTVVDAARAAAVGALGRFDGRVISRDGDVFATAVQGIDAQVNAHRVAVVGALSAIEGSIIGEGVAAETYESLGASITATESVRAYVRNDVTGNITSSAGSIYVNAQTIQGSQISASNGFVGLDVFGNLDGQVQGGHGVTASVLGTVGSSVASAHGGVLILADGDVSGSVTAGDDKVGIGLVSWGSVSASLTAASGPVTVAFSYGDVSGPIDAGKEAHVNTWGSVTNTVAAEGDVVIVARNNVDLHVTAGRDARITVGQRVTGPVSADRDALVYANEDILAGVTGGRHATADALGVIHANVTATSGDALVSVLGDYSGAVVAGRHATVTTGGPIASSTITAGNTAQVSAHGQLTGSQVTANRDAFILGDKSIGTSQFQANGGSVVVAALDGISQVQVQAAEHAQVFAGTNAKLTATATGGNLEVVALGNLEGTFTAGNDALVAAYGAVGGGETSVSITATGGAASVFGADGVSATATGQSVTATSLEDVKGTFTATGGETGVYAGGSFDGDAVAQQSAGVTAQREIKGHVTSSYRNAWAYVWGDGPPPPPAPPPEPPAEPPPPPPPPPGNISAEVSGFANATATALSGGVTGEVKATQGNATVTARTELTGKVTAGRDARVWVIGPVSSPEIQAGRDAYVTSYAAISSPVTTTGGDANVSAGTTLSGAVTGQQSASAQARTGDLSGDVTANVSDASAAAGGNVSGSVTGQRHALAGALGSVNGDVTATAGHASAVARGGQVTGTVTAGQSAGAFALGNITGNVYAGRDAIAATLGSSIGSVTAGRDALAVAGSAVSGPVTGGRDAGVLAFGPVSAGVNAASGDAFVVTWGVVSNSVSAGDSAFVAAGNGGSVTVSAPRDAAVVSFGPLMAFVQAGRDGYAWSAGTLTGNLQTGRDGAVISLAAASMGLATGRDAYAWTFDQYHSNIFAGRDALVVSLGDVNGGVFAGGSGLIYAVEDAIGSVTAGEYAGVVTWGDAAGPMSVKGPEGAFAWSYGDFNGFVESSAGSAFLTAYGNGIGAVRGAEYAAAYVVGDWLGDIEGGDDAGGVALGSFNGNVTAGASGYAISEGDVDASITAARDVLVWAIGDVTGNYDAGRDAAAVSYGAYNASLSAGRDVVTVWARGNLSGSIEAGRNVGTADALGTGLPTSPAYAIFSYGQIDATISALNPAGLSGGGHVYPVAAWGSIDGLIEAADTIHEVRSGDAVTATLIAPNVPVPIEFDTTILTQYPYPATPDSVLAEVLADAAAEYALVLAAKAQVADQITALLADFAADKAAEASRLANAITQATAAVTQAMADAVQALTADSEAAAAQFATERAAAAAELDTVAHEVATAEAALRDRRYQVVGRRDAAYAAAVAFAGQVVTAMATADTKFANALSQAHADALNLSNLRTTDEYWASLKHLLQSSPMAGIYHLPPPREEQYLLANGHAGSFWHAWWSAYPVYVWQGGTDTPVGFWDRALNVGTKLGWLAAGTAGAILGVMYAAPAVVGALGSVGIPASACAVGGKIVGGLALARGVYTTIEGIRHWDQMTPLERDHFVAELGFDLATAGLSRYAKLLKCFTAETEVQVPEGSGGVWYATGAGVFALGVTGLLVASRPPRRKKDQDDEEGDSDIAIGGSFPESSDDDDGPVVQPDDRPEAFEELCDRLFNSAEPEVCWLAPGEQDETGHPVLAAAVPRRPSRAGCALLPGGGRERTLPARLGERVETRTRPRVEAGPRVSPARRSPSRAEPRTRAQSRPRSWGASRRLAFIGSALSFVLAAFFVLQGWRASHETTRTIADLRVGQKVITNAPSDALAAAERDLPAPGMAREERLDPVTWKLVRLRAHLRWDDGTLDDINVETLQSPSWLAAHEVRVGGEAPIPLDLEELGLPDVLGTVTAIEPCPSIQPGPGRVIRTTVNHLNADVHELTIRDDRGTKETIRTTGGHKFYSVARAAWVSAAELRPHERLDGLQGPVYVVSVARRPGVHRVYNMTVEGEHVYHVSSLGVLTHNSWACFGLGAGPEGRAVNFTNPARLGMFNNERHHPIPEFLGGRLRQALHSLDQATHDAFHIELDQTLRRRGFPLSGLNGSAEDWADHFRRYPGSQREAFDALLEAARHVDYKLGTSVTSAIWDNLLAGNFDWF